MSHVFGYAVEDVVGSVGWDFVHPDDLAGAQERFDDVVRNGGTVTFLLRLRAADGTTKVGSGTGDGPVDACCRAIDAVVGALAVAFSLYVVYVLEIVKLASLRPRRREAERTAA